MSPEDYKNLMENAPPEEGLAAKYEHLLCAYQEQERIMKRVADLLRDPPPHGEPMKAYLWMENLADELSPPEPLSAADAAEKFSQDAAARKPPAT